MSKIDINNNPLVQSAYTNLQAVGSDGADSSIQGHHLRWDFRKSLGDNHIARGVLNADNPSIMPLAGNNEDYVKIYKTSFDKKYYLTLNFTNTPEVEVNSGATREWKYSLSVNGLSDISRDVIVRFLNISIYDQIRASQSTFNTANFLSQYPDLIEVSIDGGDLFFSYEFNSVFQTGGMLRAETISLPDSSDTSNKQLSSRQIINANYNPIQSENIQSLRFDCINATLTELFLITYTDFITGVNNENSGSGNWIDIGQFGLTQNDIVAENRLLPALIDGKWPKYANSGTNEFKVKSSNYTDRWAGTNGVRGLIGTYLQLSETDTKAIAQISSDDVNDHATQTVSYLNLLNLLSLDYHVARILGLGHIVSEENETDFVYCMEYKTFCDLQNVPAPASEITHLFMSLPTSKSDYRLPAKPELVNPSFGVKVDNATDNPSSLTNDEGYVSFGDIRFININRDVNDYEKRFGPFFYEPTEFNLANQTQAIAYGIKYKRDGESYQKPELSHDKSYSDNDGIPETMPILNTGLSIYTHQENENGIHKYASYGINLFSRVSDLTSEISVTTLFPKKSHLLPPFNMAVQLIQDEDPTEILISDKTLVLTTQAEQTALVAHNTSNTDSVYVRTSFDWNQIHHNAHQFADYAEILFRKSEPLVVKGKVLSVTDLPNNMASITTVSYPLNSMSTPAATIQPAISASEKDRFIGSYFSSGNNNYLIKEISTTGNNPTFIVEKIKTVEALRPDKDLNRYLSLEKYDSPFNNDLFFAIENFGDLTNWDLRHTRKIYLEKFFTNSQISLHDTGTSTIKYYSVNSLVQSTGETEIFVEEDIDFNPIFSLSIGYYVKHNILSISANQITINGDHTSYFQLNPKFNLFGSTNNDKEYTIDSSAHVSGQTIINIIAAESFSDISNDTGKSGFIQLSINKSIHSINQSNNSFTILGDLSSELDIANIEYKTESDGTNTRFVVGGLNDSVTFSAILDAEHNETGYLEIVFDNLSLDPHSDPEVIWDKGLVRLTDINGNTRPYPVSYLGDKTGHKTTPLTLVIQDSDFIPDTGSGSIYSVDVNAANTANYHPSYKLYLIANNGIDTNGNAIPVNDLHFNEESILPSSNDFTEGNRKTYMAIRSVDVKKEVESYISSPVVLMAQRTSKPLAPSAPTGPKYATRPNFYGKSTYTFDVKVNTSNNRVPYSLVFYRGSAALILSALYKKDTIEQIWNSLNNLSNPSDKYDTSLWNILIDVSIEVLYNDYKFTTHSATGFIWPKLDNEDYISPFDSNTELDIVKQNGLYRPFADSSLMSLDCEIYNRAGVSGVEVVKKAILSAFVPLNEQPPVFNYIKTGKQTSSEKSIFRDINGNLLDAATNDLFPMIKKYVDSGDTYLRFTDYTLDGASSSMYFYLAMEMSDKFKFSPPSPAVGPVLMVNSAAVDKPQIRSAKTQLQDSIMEIGAAITFEINDYLPSDNVTKIKLYRALSEEDALSIRSMQHIKTFNLEDEIIDDFADDTNPLFGEDLNYRIVAVKEIQEIEDVIHSPQVQTVEIESLPSDTIKISLVDSVNPDAPEIVSSNTVTATVVRTDSLSEVVLKWNPTCYNGKYRLQKMNSMGNWADVYSVNSKSEPMQYPPLDSNQNPDFANFSETALLARKDDNGNKIYHRYRVVVENSSGLFNSYQNEITLATGLNDLARTNDFFSFEDNSQLHSLDTLQSVAFNEGSCSPDTMKFKFLEFVLPAGHNTILSIAVTVKDDLDNESTKTISNPSFNDEITFNTSDGIQLDSSNPNRIYTVTTDITTDYVDIDNNAIASFKQVFILDYLNGRYNNLWNQRLDMLPIVTEAAVVSVKDKLVIIGGTDGVNGINSVREYDFTSNEITEKNDWEDRIQCLAVEFTDEAYIIGGYQGDPTNIISELNKYDPASDMWSPLGNMPFNARLNAVFVNYEDKFYYGLGEDESGNVLSDWWEYDIVNNTWTGKNDAPTPITQASYFVLHDGIYVIGGKTDNGETFDCWRYDINSGNWVQIASLPNPNNETGLYQSAGFSNDNYGYVCGGANSATVFSQDVWRYCIQNDEWCKVSNFNGDAARIQSSVVVIENSVYIIGGYKQDGTVCSEIWEFTF